MRKTVTVVIPDEGRDKGKTFLLTEMSSNLSERWATRFFFALGHAGVDFPDAIKGLGLAGVAIVGMQAIERAKVEDAEPLLAELFECVQIVPDPASHPEIVRKPTNDDIEEFRTRLYLKSEVVALHLGFSLADVLSKLMAAEKSAGSSNTQISPDSSESLSPGA